MRTVPVDENVCQFYHAVWMYAQQHPGSMTAEPVCIDGTVLEEPEEMMRRLLIDARNCRLQIYPMTVCSASALVLYRTWHPTFCPGELSLNDHLAAAREIVEAQPPTRNCPDCMADS